MQNKISVGEVIKYLYYLKSELSGFRIPEKYLREGIYYHNRLGFNNTELYQRWYNYRKGKKHSEWWLVRGVPDRIVNEGKEIFVDELKTYRGGRKKDDLLEIGYTQANIYAWLLGIPKCRVYIYDPRISRLDEYEYDFSWNKARRDIGKGIKIKKKLKKFKDSLR